VAERGTHAVSPTQLEGLARCAWQTFLRRSLRLAPVTDPLDALAQRDARALGRVVDVALQRLIQRSSGGERRTLAEALAAGPFAVAPPDGDAITDATLAAARTTLAEDRLRWDGFAQAFAHRARPFVERAVALLWPSDGSALQVLGTQTQGSVEFPRATVGFIADIAVRTRAGAKLVDLKTGKPVSDAKKEDTRRRHFVAKTALGKTLQVPIYAAAAGASESAYLFVDPELGDELARVECAHDDAELRRTLLGALDVLVPAWKHGAFVARVEMADSKDNDACRTCELEVACPRSDSAARRRIVELGAESTPAASEDALRAFVALWRLGTSPDAGDDA
jgi:RecB family exonuclease